MNHGIYYLVLTHVKPHFNSTEVQVGCLFTSLLAQKLQDVKWKKKKKASQYIMKPSIQTTVNPKSNGY